MLKSFWHKKPERTEVLCTSSKTTEKQSAYSPDGAMLPHLRKSQNKQTNKGYSRSSVPVAEELYSFTCCPTPKKHLLYFSQCATTRNL